MIHVVKKWYIDADKHQYILFRKEEKENQKTGEVYEVRTNCSFHTSISSCLHSLISTLHRKKVSKYDMELGQALKEFQKIESLVLKSANKEEI